MMAARGMTTLAVCFQFIPHSSSLFAAVPAVGHVGTERTGGSYGKEERRIGGKEERRRGGGEERRRGGEEERRRGGAEERGRGGEGERGRGGGNE